MYQRKKPLDTDASSISSLANKSRKTLQELYNLAKSQNEDLTTSILYNVNGRFNVWGSNLAAFRRKDSVASLDWRLRKAEQMTEAVKTTLIEIIQASEEADPILRDNRRNGQKSDMEALFEGIDLEDPENQELSEFLSSITTELDALLNSIALSVDRLFTLAMLIRREATNQPHGNHQGNISPGTDPGRDNHILRLKDKHPGLLDKEWLQLRLADAFDHRRSSILHLQTKHPVPSFEVEAETGSSQHGPSVAATTYQEDGKRHEGSEDGSVSSTASFVTKTSFVTAIQTGEDGELGIMDLERLTFHNVQLRYEESFDCPLCREFILVTSREEWKNHILSDLRPYMCTFQTCPVTLFSKRHEWFGHELEFHRMIWHCHKCESRFDTAELLRKHFIESHKHVVPESHIPMILKSASRPTQDFSNQPCPFCRPLWYVPRTESTQAMALCRHIGKHFQELAVLAIPAVIEGLEIQEEEEDEDEGDSHGERETENDALKTEGQDAGDDTESVASDGQGSIITSPDATPVSNRHITTEIKISGRNGVKQTFNAIWLESIAHNIVTARVQKALGLRVRRAPKGGFNAVLPGIGNKSFQAFVSAAVSDFGGEDWEHEVDFFVLDTGQLQDADVILGSSFLGKASGNKSVNADRISEDVSEKTHVISVYRIRRDVLKAWLTETFGPNIEVEVQQGNFIIMTPGHVPGVMLPIHE